MLSNIGKDGSAPAQGAAPGLARRACRKAVDLVFRSPRWAFNLTVGILGAVAFAATSQLLFERLPMLDDGVAALYQARIFAAGQVVWPVAHDLKPWFDIFGVITPIGKPDVWAGMYPPGWPSALSVGVWFGAPWLVNPVLGGCLISTISDLGSELYDVVTGRVAALLALFSPMLGVVSATHLSHTSAALTAALAWLGALRLQSTGRYWYAVIAGGSLAACLLIRPVAAFFIGVIIAIGVLARLRRALALWRQLAVAAAIVVVGVITLLAFQHVASGQAGVFGHQIQMGDKAVFGFGRVGDSSYIYTPAEAIRHTLGRIEALDWRLLGWPVPMVALLIIPFLLRRAGWRETWLLAPVLVLSGLFFFYWYFEEWLPGRYLFTAAPMLIVLAARGWYLWHDSFGSSKRFAWLPALAFGAGTVWSATIGAADYHRQFQRDHGDVEHNLAIMMRTYKVSDALVFMRSDGRLPNGEWNDYYATGFMRNTLNLDGDIVFARNGSGKEVQRNDEELIRKYPDRNYYLYEYKPSSKRSRLFRLMVEDGRIVKKRKLGRYP